MSLKTWKAEFYPETAKQAAKRGDVAACEHSLKKWEGALPSNPERHGVTFGSDDKGLVVGVGESRNMLYFGEDSCALCALHANNACYGCPLFIADGRRCGPSGSPYRRACVSLDPRPMVAALKRALKYAQREARKKQKGGDVA